MDSNIIFRGEDKLISFTVADSFGTLINLTGYTGIVVQIIDSNENVLAKYSRELLSGHNNVDFEEFDQTINRGGFQVKLQSAVTKAIPIGKICFEIKFQSNEPAYDNNTFDQIVRIEKANNQKTFEVKDARTKHLINLS